MGASGIIDAMERFLAILGLILSSALLAAVES